jgi:hypothetical protein
LSDVSAAKVCDETQFERDLGEVMVGTVTSVKGREPYRVIGVRGPGVSENYLIPEQPLAIARSRLVSNFLPGYISSGAVRRMPGKRGDRW